jgi:hypothetical protein
MCVTPSDSMDTPACRFECAPVTWEPPISVPESSLLPTPTASSYGSCRGGGSGRVGKWRASLSAMAKHNTVADAAGNGRGEERQEQGRGSQGSEAQGDFWGGPARGGSGPERVGWWAVEPGVGRVADGVPERVDRLRALGNAIVPQIAQVIARGIKVISESTQQDTE